MKQLLQNLKSGEMKLLDVPVPALTDKNVLVRVHYSLISAGTEGSKVSTARKGYLGKAKDKPEQVKQVINTLKSEGFSSTYRKVMNKLDAWAPLGYSGTGEVIEVGSGVNEFKIGDRVACGGTQAAHAEVVSVSVNLCIKVPESVHLEYAAYTTLGAIALQGIRQADLRLGESCAVIGLGLLGQLTVQMLKASGITVAGIDLDTIAVKNALKSGADLAIERNDANLEQAVAGMTSGLGVDAVIITAGTTSLDPVELAGRLARKKGKIIIVGAVPTGFSRETYYQKELDLRMSCSYGPGRYDPIYEEHGLDYPYAYVRWTEKRNMEAFLKMIQKGKISFDHLTTHQFNIDQAPQAYELILNKSEPFLGILLKYEIKADLVRTVQIPQSTIRNPESKINLGFIGAGSFAQNYLLPNIKDVNAAALIGVATSSGNTSRTVAEKFGFGFATTNGDDIIRNKDINTVFIATRHNLHAGYVMKALKANKNVFVEKPLAITEAQLEEIRQVYSTIHNPQSAILMVGFNRRFAPHIQKIKEIFHTPPLAINYRINAGFIPAGHWTQDQKVGGGRIIGEVCHFVDLAMYLSGSKPISVSAATMEDTQHLNDNIVVNLKFENGSIAAISYFANGSNNLKKEYLEVFGNGTSVVLNDFKELTIYGKKTKRSKSTKQNKGHREEINRFLTAVKEGKSSPIPFEEIYISSLLPFRIIESIKTGTTIRI